jgi:hypothetical protein
VLRSNRRTSQENDDMDPNSTNYGTSSSGAGNSTLGGGTDSLGVTGSGAGQGMTDQSLAGGSQVGGAQGGAQGGAGIGERLSDARAAAGDKLSQARDAASERLGQARERAGEFKSTLADKLEQGAQSLRQQGGAQQFAGANGGTADAATPLNRYATPAAAAMERTAEFLRGEGDLKGVVEEQVRTNPGRTLLIAVGLGYLLGKAIRR